MYLRGIHAEPTLSILRQFIHDNPLGVLTTFIHQSSSSSSAQFPNLQQTHIPWVLDDPPAAETSGSDDDELAAASAGGSQTQPHPLGLLRAHLARANPHAKALVEAAAAAAAAAASTSSSTDCCSSAGMITEDCTVLFTLPQSHYITPQYYTTTKPETGKVVPTYNYAAVQVYGRLKVYHDAKAAGAGVYLGKQIEDLTREAEIRAGYGSTEVVTDKSKGPAWKVSDAPKPYIEILKKSILGIEVEITDLQGKWKMSQELKEGGG